MGETRRKGTETEVADAPKKTKKTSKVNSRDKASRKRYRDSRPDLQRSFRNWCRHGGLSQKDGSEKARKLMDTEKFKAISLVNILKAEQTRLEERKALREAKWNNSETKVYRLAKRQAQLKVRILAYQEELKQRNALALQIGDLTSREIPTESYQLALSMCRDPEAIENDISRLSSKLKRMLDAS